MTRQQRFQKLVDKVSTANKGYNKDNVDESMAKFYDAMYKLAYYCWRNASRIAVRSEDDARLR